MVYSGDMCIYGVQLTMDNVIKYIKLYAKNYNPEIYQEITNSDSDSDNDNDNNNDNNNDNDNDNDNDSDSDNDNDSDSDSDREEEDIYYYSGIVDKLKIGVELYGLPCCLFDRETVYLGVIITENEIVYRSNINDFDTFDEYCQFISRGIDKIKTKINSMELDCQNALKRILPQSKINTKYYSFANDCDSCT